jgi:hypothetical protein
MDLSKKSLSFDSWALNVPVIPERSRVISLQPISIGSLDVESLTSYIQRIAEAHSVTTGSFTKEMLLPYLIDDELNKTAVTNTHYRIYIRSFSINGFKSVAKSLTTALNELTLDKDKEHLTLLKLAEFMHISDLKTVRQWCPYCFEDFMNNRKAVYEKLIWNIKIVNVCLLHKCFLHTKCPHCGVELWYLNTKSRVGYCDKCNGWLGSEMKQSSDNWEEIEINWQIFVHDSLDYLLSSGVKLNKEEISKKFKEFLSTSLENNNITKKDFAESMGFNRFTIFEWIRGRGYFSLYSLFLVCYCANISLKSFLEDDVSLIKINKINRAPQKKDLDNKKIKISIEERGNFLKKIIEKNEYPPPKLGDVIKMLGFLSNESLRAYFPNESKLISKRYKEYKSQIKKEKLMTMENKMEESILDCLEKGIYPSIHILAKNLGVHNKLIAISLKHNRFEILKKMGVEVRSRGKGSNLYSSR